MTEYDSHRIEGLQYLGIGVVFITEAGVVGALGWWCDSKFGTEPWLLVAGTLAGVTLATIGLIRRVTAAEQRDSASGPRGGAKS